jgi:hypothetical protein
MMSGFARMSAAFETLAPSRVLKFRLTLPDSRYPDGIRIAMFHDALLDRLAAIPDVERVALVWNEPATSRTRSSRSSVKTRRRCSRARCRGSTSRSSLRRHSTHSASTFSAVVRSKTATASMRLASPSSARLLHGDSGRALLGVPSLEARALFMVVACTVASTIAGSRGPARRAARLDVAELLRMP